MHSFFRGRSLWKSSRGFGFEIPSGLRHTEILFGGAHVRHRWRSDLNYIQLDSGRMWLQEFAREGLLVAWSVIRLGRAVSCGSEKSLFRSFLLVWPLWLAFRGCLRRRWGCWEFYRRFLIWLYYRDLHRGSSGPWQSEGHHCRSGRYHVGPLV